MGFYRSIIKGTPHSMSGGFYSSSWQAAQEETYGYLCKIWYNTKITSLNITNSIRNEISLSDRNHPDFPVCGSGANTNNVNGINISNYNKLFLNSDCSSMFSQCNKCIDWSGINSFDFSYVQNCYRMFGGCINFNQPITLGNLVKNCSNMFWGSVGSGWANCVAIPVPDIFIKGTTFRSINILGMLSRPRMNAGVYEYNINRNVRTNIHFNSILQNQFLQTGSGLSVTHTAISWKAMEDRNGYYNAKANIYLYNNYEG